MAWFVTTTTPHSFAFEALCSETLQCLGVLAAGFALDEGRREATSTEEEESFASQGSPSYATPSSSTPSDSPAGTEDTQNKALKRGPTEGMFSELQEGDEAGGGDRPNRKRNTRRLFARGEVSTSGAHQARIIEITMLKGLTQCSSGVFRQLIDFVRPRGWPLFPRKKASGSHEGSYDWGSEEKVVTDTSEKAFAESLVEDLSLSTLPMSKATYNAAESFVLMHKRNSGLDEERKAEVAAVRSELHLLRRQQIFPPPPSRPRQDVQVGSFNFDLPRKKTH